jgi:hypothetical protein
MTKIKGLEHSPSSDFNEWGKLLDPINERLPWRLPASDGMFEAMRDTTARTAGLLRTQTSETLSRIRPIRAETLRYTNGGCVEIPMPSAVSAFRAQRHEDPTRIKRFLNRLLPPERWTGFSHRLIIHGRRVCYARNPACARCVLNELCPSRES